MISFQKSIDLTQIEDAYSDLDTIQSDKLRLPIQLKFGGTFGITASLIQFIITWARNNDKRALTTFGSKSGISAFSEFILQPHGLIAAYMAPNLLDSRKQPLEKSEVLRQAHDLIESMNREQLKDTMKGRGVFLACLAGAKQEFLLPLYSKQNSSSIRETDDFKKLTYEIIRACSPKLLTSKKNIRNIQNISTLIRELFENTNDHARSDIGGRQFEWDYPNPRIIFAKFLSIDSTSRKKGIFHGDPNQSFHIMRSILNRNDANSIHDESFLELSVIDGGPGILKRWLLGREQPIQSNDLSIEDEKTHVQETFELGKTSKQLNGAGNGLDSVVKSLNDLNAMLRLRTGRICLYQDFSKKETLEFSPIHWFPNRPKLNETSGTAFSILIPLPRN